MATHHLFSYIMARTSFWWDDDDDVRLVLVQHDELDLYCASSLKQSTGRHCASPDTLFWFRANQSLLSLISAAYLAEKQQIPIL